MYAEVYVYLMVNLSTYQKCVGEPCMQPIHYYEDGDFVINYDDSDDGD